MKMLLVSVIIPTYKSDSTLSRAIDSVLNQTYKNFEIIVVDDNDPETEYRKNTEKLMQKYIGDERIKYIKHEKNKNGSAARNTGFKNSSGEYICFLDDDDYFLPDKIEKQVEHMENNKQYGANYTWRIENILGKPTVIKSDYKGDLSRQILTLEFTPFTSSLMIRRECIIKLNGFDESFYRHQDFEFLLRFFDFFEIDVVKEPLVIRDTDRVSNRPKGKKLDEIRVKFLSEFDGKINQLDKKEPGIKKKIIASHYVELTKTHIRNRNILLALKAMLIMTIHNCSSYWSLFVNDIISAIKRRMGYLDEKF